MEIFEWIVIRVRRTGKVKVGQSSGAVRRVAYCGSSTVRRTLISNHMVFLMKESELWSIVELAFQQLTHD